MTTTTTSDLKEAAAEFHRAVRRTIEPSPRKLSRKEAELAAAGRDHWRQSSARWATLRAVLRDHWRNNGLPGS